MDTNVFTYYIETESDVLNLVNNKVIENINLDYKACDSLQKKDGKKSEISKDVSAFANADGGTIIYGVIEENDAPKKIDVGYDPNDITREWLDQVINSNIRPRIDGIIINPITLNTKAPSKVIYAVHVPKATTAHQASDKRYHKRLNTTTKHMEDYEIRDIMNRRKHPIIEPCFNFHKLESTPAEHHYKLLIKLKNEGVVCAKYMKFIIVMPIDIIDISNYSAQANLSHNKNRILCRHETVKIFSDSRKAELWFNYSMPDNILFPEEEQKIVFQLLYKVNRDIFDNISKYEINWKLYADNMPSKSGCLALKDYQNF